MSKDKVKELARQIETANTELQNQALLFVEKGNKAAVARARAAAMEIKNLTGDFRKAIQEAKSEA